MIALERVRLLLASQDSHSSQLPQEETTQSTGQAPRLHAESSCPSSQAVPSRVERLRYRTPVSQVVEQTDHCCSTTLFGSRMSRKRENATRTCQEAVRQLPPSDASSCAINGARDGARAGGATEVGICIAAATAGATIRAGDSATAVMVDSDGSSDGDGDGEGVGVGAMLRLNEGSGDGSCVGDIEGNGEGSDVGGLESLGLGEGSDDGSSDGAIDGVKEGVGVGATEGDALGSGVGAGVGASEAGAREGAGEGAADGAEDGDALGEDVGLAEGEGVGAVVGEGVHAAVLHIASSIVGVGHDWAMPIGELDAERDLAAVPPPQATEQSSQAPQLPMTQSAQGSEAHGLVLTSTGHSRPPAIAASTANRRRCELPEAHSWSQMDQAPQLVIVQSTGHAATSAHETSSLVGAHATPPSDACAVASRARPRMPEPQVAEHRPHACQALVAQSTGHAVLEHCRASAREGHAAPPSLAAVEMER